MLDQITPVILARDEEANLARTLAQLAWANDIVLVDSFSVDATVEIARGFPNVRIFRRQFDTLAGQSNHGLDKARTPWALLLDADYFVPVDLVNELRTLKHDPGVRAYQCAFIYAVHGRRLRASLYPPRVVLLDRGHCSVWQDGHAHRVAVEGDTGKLYSKIIHDDRKSFARFVARQRAYMSQEAAKLHQTPSSRLNIAGRLRKMVVIAPIAVLLHTLFFKGLLLEGLPGLHYTLERVTAELFLSWEIIKYRLAPNRPRPTS